MRLTSEVTIDRPPSHVFPLFGALERSDEYLDGFERIKETDGPTRLGTRWKAIDQWPGRKVEFTVEVTEWEPFESMATAWTEPMNGGWRATFSPVGSSGTHIDFEMEMSPSGFMGLIISLSKPWASRQTKKFMGSVKEWIEHEPLAEDEEVQLGGA